MLIGMSVAVLIMSLFLVANVGIDISFDSVTGKLELSAKAMGLSIRISGGKGKKKPSARPREKTVVDEAARAAKERKKPDRELIDLLIKNVPDVLRRIRRKLTIDRLVLRFKAASTDAAKAALLYGRANAVIGNFFPILDTALRVRDRDIETTLDFSSDKPEVYMRIVAVFQIWELFYIAGNFAVEFLSYKYRTR